MKPITECPDGVFATAARCADCQEGACMKACPEQIDLRALFEFVASQAPMPLAWRNRPDESETFVGEAINHSFE